MSKIKWPFDAAITIAILALILSTLQFVFNSPILIKYYFKPKLIIQGSGSLIDSETSKITMGQFLLRNEGNVEATNVEVGFALQANQSISVSNNIKSKITTTENPILMKDVRIEIPRLNAGELVSFIMISKDKDGKLHKEYEDFLKSAGITEIPYVSFIKSDQGPGENRTISNAHRVYEHIKKTN